MQSSSSFHFVRKQNAGESFFCVLSCNPQSLGLEAEFKTDPSGTLSVVPTVGLPKAIGEKVKIVLNTKSGRSLCTLESLGDSEVSELYYDPVVDPDRPFCIARLGHGSISAWFFEQTKENVDGLNAILLAAVERHEGPQFCID